MNCCVNLRMYFDHCLYSYCIGGDILQSKLQSTETGGLDVVLHLLVVLFFRGDFC